MYLQKGQTISDDAGHNCYPDSGAVGIRTEDSMTKEVIALVNAKLRANGYNVVDCTPYNASFGSVGQSLSFRVNKANSSGSAFHLCMHFNKFNGQARGSEVWIDSAAGDTTRQYAQQILNELVALGFTNRGVKVGDLYVPKYTKMDCVLVEGCFIDNSGDMAIYNAEKMANAIVKALTGIDTQQPVQPKVPEIGVRYQAHVQNEGWQEWKKNDEVSGSTGKSLRMEGLVIVLENAPANMDIEAYGHVQNIGWQSLRHTGEAIGSVSKSLRLEAVKIKLVNAPKEYHIEYSAHVEGIGWQNYVRDGEVAGTTGQSIRLEAIKIRIVKA